MNDIRNNIEMSNIASIFLFRQISIQNKVLVLNINFLLNSEQQRITKSSGHKSLTTLPMSLPIQQAERNHISLCSCWAHLFFLTT